MKSTTARSLELLRAEGYEPEVVEKYNAFSKRKNDLFGMFDILAIHKLTGDVMAVQTTTVTNISSRINKIIASAHLGLIRKAGWTIQVHGWRKVKNRWQARRENIS